MKNTEYDSEGKFIGSIRIIIISWLVRFKGHKL